MTARSGTGVGFYELLHDLVYILAAVTLVFVFVVRLVGVSGNSMYPTLCSGDLLILESHLFSGVPQTGDIVVMRVPYFEEEPIIKRVIATGGQTVDIDFVQGVVYVDGEALTEPYINEPTHRDFGPMGLDYPVTVPDGCLFVLGDNRNASDDSRFSMVGMVDERNVLGKALWIVLPGADAVTQEREFGRIGGLS